MWYVIQAKTGDEQKVKALLETQLSGKYYADCFIPLYESVRRRQQKSLIELRRLLPGYLFIDTDFPEEVHKAIKKIPDFAAVLGAKEEKDKEKVFIPIGEEDRQFLDSVLDDGIMHVSYVRLSKANKIEKVIGPLKGYKQFIRKMEFRHRYATVEAEIFGKRRKIDFGLWSNADPKIPWLEELRKAEEIDTSHKMSKYEALSEIDIYPGDKVEYPEVYGETVFEVESVDVNRRVIHTSIEMFGSSRKIEMYLEDVRKIG